MFTDLKYVPRRVCFQRVYELAINNLLFIEDLKIQYGFLAILKQLVLS